MAKMERAGAREALAEAKGQFHAWRESRRRGQRIPERLWQVAVDLLSHYTVEQVAGRLALNRGHFEKRLAAQRGGGGERRLEQPTLASGFVEIGRLGAGYADGCTIETEDGSGARLTVRLSGGACAQASEIVKALREERG